MEYNLKQEVPQLVGEITPISSFDGVGHLIRLFNRVRRYGREILFEIPGAAASRRAESGHDRQKVADISGRLQLRPHKSKWPGQARPFE